MAASIKKKSTSGYDEFIARGGDPDNIIDESDTKKTSSNFTAYSPYPVDGGNKTRSIVNSGLRDTGSSGGSGANTTIGNSTSTSTVTFNGKQPVLGDAPVYTAPEYDRGEIDKISQRISSPYIRNLRQAAELALSRRSDNPNINKLTLREALGSYGQGLERVLSGAASQATNEYNTEYGMKVDESKTNYGANVEKWRTSFNAAWEKYMSSVTQKTSSSNSNISRNWIPPSLQDEAAGKTKKSSSISVPI